MWITDVFLVIILLVAVNGFCRSETFTSYYGGTELIWNNNLYPKYTTQQDDKIAVFNPAAYRK